MEWALGTCLHAGSTGIMLSMMMSLALVQLAQRDRGHGHRSRCHLPYIPAGVLALWCDQHVAAIAGILVMNEVPYASDKSRAKDLKPTSSS